MKQRKYNSGLACPKCSHGHSSIYCVKSHGTFLRRKRRCQGCDHEWTTEEMAVEAPPIGRPRGDKEEKHVMDLDVYAELRKKKERGG